MKKNIEKELLKKIITGEVKMKPRWWFEMIDVSEKSGVLIFFTAGVVLVGMAIYIVSLISPRELIGYGSTGVEVLLENISYPKLLGGLILGGMAAIIFSRIGANYKKNRYKIGFVLLITLVLLVVLMTGLRILLEL